MRVAIVGAGFSGIAMAIALRRNGIEDFTIFERASDLGGVWHHNTYPGAACDVPSYMYSFSYEQRRDWTQPCSPQREIHDYLHDVARKHDLVRRMRFGCEVASAAWDDAAARWHVRPAGGEEETFDALVIACGQLNRPHWPEIAGMEDFAGHSFHSAEWDHGYDLRGKRVAVVGTGASAIQFIPEIAKEVAHLDVYQRTPPWLLPRRNPVYPGWVRALIRHVPGAQTLRRAGMRAFMESGIAGQTRVAALRTGLHLWSSLFMRLQVRDRELRRKTRPDYPIGCKRVLFSSYYLPALQQPHVDLVTDRIERITERGVRTVDGAEREVDCIVYGTGFRATEFVLPMQVAGAEGRALHDAWAHGAEAHLGITVAGFPNMFLLYGPNTNLGFGSIIVMIEAQVNYVIDALRLLRSRGAAAIEVRPEVQRASDDEVQRRLRHSVWTNCRSWYRTDEGRVVNNWPGFMAEYEHVTRQVDPGEYRLLQPRPEREPAAA